MKLSLVFTSDEHGYLAGAPAVQRVVDGTRAENPERTLFVSSGDVFQGAPESDLGGGKPGLEMMRTAHYDVVEVGNHDFDNGPDFFRQWARTAGYPVLAGNLKEKATGKPVEGTRPWVIEELGGVKVGLLGVVTPDSPNLGYARNFEPFLFEDPVETARRSAEELKSQGCDVVGVLSHLGTEGDRALARAVKVDFILGGHTHEMREQPEMVNGVPICQPGSFRNAVGRLDLELDPSTHRPVGFQHQLIRVGPQEDSGSEVGQLARHYLDEVERSEGAPVAELDHDLNFKPRLWDPMDAELALAMQQAAGTRISLHNQKLPRQPLKAGPVTGKDLRATLPFPNEVVKVTLTREQLRQVVEAALNRPDETSLFPGGVGIVTGPQTDPNKPIEVEKVTYEDGSPLPERVEVATTDFLAQGALNYPLLKTTSAPSFGLVRKALQTRLGLGIKLRNAEPDVE